MEERAELSQNFFNSEVVVVDHVGDFYTVEPELVGDKHRDKCNRCSTNADRYVPPPEPILDESQAIGKVEVEAAVDILRACPMSHAGLDHLIKAGIKRQYLRRSDRISEKRKSHSKRCNGSAWSVCNHFPESVENNVTLGALK